MVEVEVESKLDFLITRTEGRVVDLFQAITRSENHGFQRDVLHLMKHSLYINQLMLAALIRFRDKGTPVRLRHQSQQLGISSSVSSNFIPLVSSLISFSEQN